MTIHEHGMAARLLLEPILHHNEFEIIEEYISTNVQMYVSESCVNDEKEIFGSIYYGIDGAGISEASTCS